MADFKSAYKQANAKRIAALKAKDAKRKAERIKRQTEIAYRQYSPPQIAGYPERVRNA